jgi:phenylalanyl-tRNA synthetase beta chain
MNVVSSWLREYCDWTWTTEELVEKLTMAGVEVEAVEQRGVSGEYFRAAKVISYEKHPNADRLRLCQVDDGEGKRQIVCGASNFEAGDVVPLALPGAVMPGGFKIKKSKLRGETSEGMMCAAEELGLPTEEGKSEGLLILDSGVKPGTRVDTLFAPEVVFEIEVTPNRPDLLSYRGLARELIALGADSKPLPFRERKEASAKDLPIEVADQNGCPRYTASRVAGVKVGPSPDWMKHRLEAQGLRPINIIVDITNYVLMETGQPLHAFDAAKLEGGIRVRRANSGETILALDGKTYELDNENLVIADQAGPIAIAGVMGGELSGVTEATTDLILESAEFQGSLVRSSARRLALHSDSSYRFERGVDPAGIDLARQRALELIEEYAGGRDQGMVESTSWKETRHEVELRPGSIERLLGYQLSDERTAEILTGLGLEKSEQEQWSVPSYRRDLQREVDLLEEVARIEGLERVIGSLPAGAAGRSSADYRDDQLSRLRQHLAGLGFHEVLTTSLVSPEGEAPDYLSLHNPLNEESSHLRASLLETILPCVRRNLGQGAPSVRLFEIGTVYGKRAKGDAEGSQEILRIAIVTSGLEADLHWKWSPEETGYFSLKGAIDNLVRLMPGMQMPAEIAPVDAKRLKAEDIKSTVWAAEWDLPDWSQPAPPVLARDLPMYPAVKRDLAFVVSREVSHEKIESVIRGTGIEELESVICFDVFIDESGQKLSADQKSVAYALTYRSPQRTLTDKDVSNWERKIIAAVESELQGRLR